MAASALSTSPPTRSGTARAARTPHVSSTAALLLAAVVLVSMVSSAAALKCYICNNCIKYELSQSRPCTPEEDKCMKMDMETGVVKRQCGTESMCTDKTELKTHYTAVTCCDEDNCNSAPFLVAPHPHVLITLLLLPLLLWARRTVATY